MNLRKFNSILRQVFLLPIIALLVIAGALYVQIRGANRTVTLIQDSDARISQATMVEKLMADEESGLRGYETTGDDRFLQPFFEAERQVSAEFERLEAVAGADADQKLYIQDLEGEYQTWRDAFALPLIATVKAGGQTTDADLNLYGKALMDKIRQDLAAINHGAEGQRKNRIALWHRQVHTMLVALLGLALSMGVVIGLFTRSQLRAVSAAYRNSLEVLGDRAEELFGSEQQLRTTLESIGDGVITCNAEGCVQMMNPVAQRLTGWSQAEATGRPLEEVLSIVNETTREPVEKLGAKIKRLDSGVEGGGDGGVAGSSGAARMMLIRKDKTELDVADSGSPILDKAGNRTGTVVVFRDITRERKTQEALVANEKLAVAGRLAATIAHEIHNPLDSVSNLLYLMRNSADEAESKQFMEMAQQELARVTQISRAMLGLYRESKAPVPVDLREMLEEILLLMERWFGELGVSLSTELPPAVTVAAFPAELRQVFTNLITNAAEAAEAGGAGGAVHIRIEPQPHGTDDAGQKLPAGATVLIFDNGAGIPDEMQSRLFQPFFTTKGEHGTGLGLWVSRGIINKHGGTIKLTSSTSGAAHGTIARVFLAANPTINTGGD